MRRPTRRSLLAAATTGLSLGLAGCSSLPFVGGDDARTDRADRRVSGTWGQHQRTGANTRRTTATGPGSKPEIAWRRQVGDVALFDPIVDDSLVYATGSDGTVTETVEAVTGERTTAPGLAGVDGSVLGIHDGVALVLRKGADGPVLGGRRVGTGEQRWTASQPAPPSPATTLQGGTAYLPGLYDPSVRALSLDDGSIRWTYEAVGTVGSVAAGDGLVSFATDTYLFGLDPATGERLWNRQFETRLTTDPVLADEAVLTGHENGDVVAVDRTGETRWRTSVGDGPVSSLALADGPLVVGTATGVVTVDVATGGRQAETDTPGAVVSLSVDGRQVYAASRDALAAFDRGSLERQWTTSPPSNQFFGGPVVLDGQVLVHTSTTDGSATDLVALATE